MARLWIELVALILVVPAAHAQSKDLKTISQSLQYLTSRMAPAVVKIVTSGYGYILEAVNGTPVKDIAALRAMLDGMETGAPLAMLANRQGSHVWVGLEPE